MTRIILDSEWSTTLQLTAAENALDQGIKVGQLWGFTFDGEVVGVKRNKASIRVYPPSPTPTEQQEKD